MSIRIFYTERAKALQKDIFTLKKLNRIFIISEVFTFVLAVGFVVLYTVVDNGLWTLLAAAIALIAYFIIRRADINNGKKIERNEDLLSVYTREISYLNGNFSCFDSGDRYIDAHHAFSFDLDIFGKDSLYNRISRTITTGGADKLSEYLSFARIKNQAEAINILAENEQWRTNFVALGQRSTIDTEQIMQNVSRVRAMNISSAAASTPALIIVYALILGLFASILLSITGIISGNVPVWWALLQFFGTLFFTAKPLKSVSKVVGRMHKHLRGMIDAIALCREISNPIPPEIKDMHTDFNNALASFGKIESVLDSLDRRENVLGLFLFNSLFMSDFFLLRKFLKWQNTYIDEINVWIDELSEVDALVSMATFKYNNPTAGKAKVEQKDEIMYKASGLYHPFLGEKGVRNDFTINNREYYIITGANMAGKSTFLRAIGINYILALNGMPVFAEHLTVSVFSLFSSMRTTDDITRGISYFNAELLRLQQLLNACSTQKHTLIILDEILKGTNSLDKLNGSRLFLQHVSTLHVSGIIATHDLELSKMEDEKRFHNYCFEIQLGTNITYSYKITPGVARNQNATYLLKQMLENIK